MTLLAAVDTDYQATQRKMLLWTAFVLLVATLLGIPLSLSVETHRGLIFAIDGVLIATDLLGIAFAYRSSIALAAFSMCVASILGVLSFVLIAGVEHSSGIIIAISIPVVVSGMIGRRIGVVLVGALAWLGLTAVVVLEETGASHPFPHVIFPAWSKVMAFLIVINILIGLVLFYRNALDGVMRRLREQLSEKEKLQRELIESQKMEALGRLSGGIAHDFNNILSVISASSQLAHETAEDTVQVREDMLEIQRAVARASKLTRHLLMFARKSETNPGMIETRDVLRGLETMLRRVLDDDVTFSTHIATDLGRTNIDPTQLEQVVVNFVLNARDAVRERPHPGVSLVAENMTLGKSLHGLPAGEYLRIRVSDNGMGMTDAVKTRVFEPFFTTKAPDRGTGLGLATSFGIARNNGGNIVVDTEANVGTEISLWLPRRTGELTSDGKPAVLVPHAPLALMRVLLVEDRPDVRRAMKRMLEHHGHRVTTFASGDDLLSQANVAKEADILVSDVSMPGIDGVVLAQRVRAQNGKIGVVLVSGETDFAALLARGVLVEGTQFLRKPFDLEELVDGMREAMR